MEERLLVPFRAEKIILSVGQTNEAIHQRQAGAGPAVRDGRGDEAQYDKMIDDKGKISGGGARRYFARSDRDGKSGANLAAAIAFLAAPSRTGYNRFQHFLASGMT